VDRALTGFLIGFLAPALLTPGSPQGPLLGVFFTIPLGFILGLIGGTFSARRKYRTATSIPQQQLKKHD